MDGPLDVSAWRLLTRVAQECELLLLLSLYLYLSKKMQLWYSSALIVMSLLVKKQKCQLLLRLLRELTLFVTPPFPPPHVGFKEKLS